MRKTETNTIWPGIDRTCKDKQTLVLFLLGCGLVGAPFLCQPGQPTPHDYVWVREQGGEGWQVISSLEGKSAPACAARATNEGWHDRQGCQNPPPALALFFNQPISLRTCRQEDLEMLPGVGSRVASAIIATRGKKGSLRSPADLLEVPGIGPSTLQRILPLVSFE